ncbi:MAG: hypothetical protein JO002_04010 [Burkholderiaceae bacterium]|nr:hypothetical protein [Burkholderiaceae bacterium]
MKPSLFIAALFAVVAPLACAAPVTYHHAKDFRELIVRGERPEIASCMVAALDHVRRNEKFSALRWNDDDSDTAIMRESETGGHLLRSVHFKAEARDRNGASLFDTWQQVEVHCEQRDEGEPTVKLAAHAS